MRANAALKAKYLFYFMHMLTQLSHSCERPKAVPALIVSAPAEAVLEPEEVKGEDQTPSVLTRELLPAPLHSALSSCCCATPLVWGLLRCHSWESKRQWEDGKGIPGPSIQTPSA